MKRVFLLVALLGVVIVALNYLDDAAHPTASGPSILFVAIDTLRADHLSLYGYPRPTSPRLEELARRGTVYERAYSAAPWTLPSFATVVTGRYPIVHRASHLRMPGTGGGEILHRGLAESAPTLERILGDAGYLTALFSSNAHLTPDFGFGPSYEHFEYSADRPARETTDAALAFLEEEATRPYFAFVHYNDPHAPYAPPAEYRFDGALPGGDPPEWSSLKKNQSPHLYDGEIAYTDAEIGRLLDGLSSRGLLDDTWIIVFADHGEEFGDHGSHGHGHSLHEEQIHIPLMIVPPSGGSGRRVTTPVSLVDLFPTVLAIAGVPDRAMDAPGKDLSQEGAPERPVFAEAINLEKRNLERATEQKGIVRGTEKLLYTPIHDRALWYDLEDDPREQAPQTSLRDPSKQELLRLLAAHINQTSDTAFSAEVSIAPATAQDLAAIGYVGGGGSGLIEIDDPMRAAGILPEPHRSGESLRLRADELRPRGFVIDGERLHKDRDARGTTAGPYRRLFPGRYEARLVLRREGGSGTLGSVRITSGGGAQEFVRHEVTTENSKDGAAVTAITLPFRIPADTQIEVLLTFEPGAIITIDPVEIHHVAEQPATEQPVTGQPVTGQPATERHVPEEEAR